MSGSIVDNLYGKAKQKIHDIKYKGTSQDMGAWEQSKPVISSKEVNLYRNGGGSSGNSNMQKPTSSSRASSYKKNNSKSNSSKKWEDNGKESALKKQKKAEKERKRKQEKAYNKLYDTLRGNLVSQRGDLDTQKNTSLSGLEQDYQNTVDRLGRGREEMTGYYDEQEGNLRDSYADQRQERERIFQARNIINSSYYIDAVTEADTEFNKTLSKLGEDEARYLAEQDTQIKELGQTKMQKRGEIEMAYNQAMRQIENDMARTDFDKANAMQQLEDEYNSKMGIIGQQLMEIQAQQQAFRDKATQMAYDKSYANENYEYNMDNESLKKKSPTTYEAMLKAGFIPNSKKEEDKTQFISNGRITPQAGNGTAPIPTQPQQKTNQYQWNPNSFKGL